MDTVVNIQRMLILKSALKLEVLGMKRSRRPSAYSAIKSEWNLKGNKERVLDQFEAVCKEAKADWFVELNK